MRVSSRVIGCCAAFFVVLLLANRLCVAQGIEADAHEAAVEAADESEAAEHGGGAHGPNPLAWDPDLAIWTLIVFLLLFAILKTFAWPQIAAAIDERERKIANDIAAAAAKNEDAKRLLADYEAKLTSAAGEVRAMLDEARRDAEHAKNQILEDARKGAQEEADRAIREIDRAKNGAKQELAVLAANAAVDLAESVVRNKLTTDEQNRIVQEAIGKMVAAAPSKN